MKYRKLFNGQKVAESPVSVAMTIDSSCPKKWAFVDMETGDIWVHKSRKKRNKTLPYDFYCADPKAIQTLVRIMVNASAEKLKKLK